MDLSNFKDNSQKASPSGGTGATAPAPLPVVAGSDPSFSGIPSEPGRFYGSGFRGVVPQHPQGFYGTAPQYPQGYSGDFPTYPHGYGGSNPQLSLAHSGSVPSSWGNPQVTSGGAGGIPQIFQGQTSNHPHGFIPLGGRGQPGPGMQGFWPNQEGAPAPLWYGAMPLSEGPYGYGQCPYPPWYNPWSYQGMHVSAFQGGPAYYPPLQGKNSTPPQGVPGSTADVQVSQSSSGHSTSVAGTRTQEEGTELEQASSRKDVLIKADGKEVKKLAKLANRLNKVQLGSDDSGSSRRGRGKRRRPKATKKSKVTPPLSEGIDSSTPSGKKRSRSQEITPPALRVNKSRKSNEGGKVLPGSGVQSKGEVVESSNVDSDVPPQDSTEVPRTRKVYLIRRGNTAPFTETEGLQFCRAMSNACLEHERRGNAFPLLSAKVARGIIEVTADDDKSLIWLRDNLNSICPWKAVLEEIKAPPPLSKVVFTLPLLDSEDPKNFEVLKCIRRTNPGLCTKDWKILNRDKILRPKGLRLVVKVDSSSLVFLKRRGLSLNFQGSRVRVSIDKETRTGKTGQGSSGFVKSVKPGAATQPGPSNLPTRSKGSGKGNKSSGKGGSSKKNHTRPNIDKDGQAKDRGSEGGGVPPGTSPLLRPMVSETPGDQAQSLSLETQTQVAGLGEVTAPSLSLETNFPLLNSNPEGKNHTPPPTEDEDSLLSSKGSRSDAMDQEL